MSPGLTRILLALTFVTGIVDAVTFLGLGQVFAAMQTGNVIFLGLGISGTAGAPFVAPLIALLAFVAGGCLAALLARLMPRPAGQGLGAALAIEVLLLAAAAVTAALAEIETGKASAYSMIALLALAMGVRNTVVRGFGGPNFATTVLNLTVAALSASSPVGLASAGDLAARAAALTAILAGAVTGALLVESSLALPIATAAAITLIAGLAHLRAEAIARPRRSEAA
jgi:uncharacterized membrane protein YoaK (UPF0700 family)